MKKIIKKSIAIAVVLAVMVSVSSVIVFANPVFSRGTCGDGFNANGVISWSATSGNVIAASECTFSIRPVIANVSIVYSYNGHNYPHTFRFEGNGSLNRNFSPPIGFIRSASALYTACWRNF
jgi:hypothetical protein